MVGTVSLGAGSTQQKGVQSPPPCPTLFRASPEPSERRCWSNPVYFGCRWPPSSSRSLENKQSIILFFLSLFTVSSVCLAAASRADQSTAARSCWTSPPTEGWRPSSWRAPCLPCGWPISPSCSFPPACAAAPSWPSTSRTLPRTPARCHLDEWRHEWHIRPEESIWKRKKMKGFVFFGNWDVAISDTRKDK